MTWRRDAAGLQRDNEGVVAVLFALMLLPLIGLVGLAIDFAVASQAKATLDLALDAATMQAVTAAAQATNNNPNASLLPADAAGVQRFAAQSGTIASVTVPPATITVTRNGTVFTAVGSYSGSYKTYLGAVFGVANMNIAGTATAVYQTQPYTDVQILLDTSSSMLVGGSLGDINNLVTLTTNVTGLASSVLGVPIPDGWLGSCAFACHWAPLGQLDYYKIAQDNKVTLRLDQLKSAISSISTSMVAANQAARYRMGLWTFNNGVTQEAALTTNVASVRSVAGNVQPALYTVLDISADGSNSDISNDIAAFAQQYVSQSGDGSSQTQPKKFIFLMTDGVEDTQYPQPRAKVIDPSKCDALKTKGAVVAVLHTTFYNPPNPNGVGNMFDEISAIEASPPAVDLVAQALQACATSPDLYYRADTQADINTAIQQFLTNVLGIPARLAN